MQYNLGLLNFELKNYDKAKDYARKAYAQRYPLPGCATSLKKAGIALDESVAQTKPAEDPAAPK